LLNKKYEHRLKEIEDKAKAQAEDIKKMKSVDEVNKR
jgi:hypothetical protein